MRLVASRGGGWAGDVQSHRPETKAAWRWVPGDRVGGSQGGGGPRWPGGGVGVEVRAVEAGAVEEPRRLFLYLDFYMHHEHIMLPFLLGIDWNILQ
jgi:hypothetical protein